MCRSAREYITKKNTLTAENDTRHIELLSCKKRDSEHSGIMLIGIPDICVTRSALFPLLPISFDRV